MRRRLKVLASQHDLSYEELLDDLVDVFEASVPFSSEAEFASWFEDNLDKFGFDAVVERRKRSSPDYRLRDADGELHEVELELVAKHFDSHGHDPEQVDRIISLFASTDQVNGVPVLTVIAADELREEVIERDGHDHTTISVPKELHADVQEFIADTGFTSPTEFTKFLLRDLVASGALEDDRPHEEHVRRVRKRLKRLGYLSEA